MKGFEEFVKKELQLEENEVIVVAVSGGPDSMALLSLLESYFKNIVCAHVNHNTGRVGQIEDEIFVKEYCEKHHHIFESMTIEKYENKNFHDQAHHMRYQFFEKLLEKYHSKYLFTAHHGDDLMETMLFRMMRGSTMRSLHGFSKIFCQNGHFIIRPLLEYTKKQLLDYNHRNHIPYRIDPSNEKDVYTRNRIRKYLLPYMKKENSNVHLKFLKLSKELEMMESYIQKQVLCELEERFVFDTLSLQNWNTLDYIIQKRILQSVLSCFYIDHLGCLEDKHIENIMELIINSRSGAKLLFPDGLLIRKEYDTLKFIKEENNMEYNLELCSDVELPNGHFIKIVKEEEKDSNFVCRLSQDEVDFPLFVRTRKPKDHMLVKGLSKSKKIKDIFINEKIPIHLRGSYPIVVDKCGKIVWLPGLKKSEFDKTKEEKYDIILKYY